MYESETLSRKHVSDAPALEVASSVEAVIPQEASGPARRTTGLAAGAPPARTKDQLLAELSGAYPAVVSQLKQRRKI